MDTRGYVSVRSVRFSSHRYFELLSVVPENGSRASMTDWSLNMCLSVSWMLLNSIVFCHLSMRIVLVVVVSANGPCFQHHLSIIDSSFSFFSIVNILEIQGRYNESVYIDIFFFSTSSELTILFVLLWGYRVGIGCWESKSFSRFLVVCSKWCDFFVSSDLQNKPARGREPSARAVLLDDRTHEWRKISDSPTTRDRLFDQLAGPNERDRVESHSTAWFRVG